MIKSVTVKNYVLIDELTLEFDKGFNVFTGETGAGKSIIIGAIDSAFGAKVSKEIIKTGTDRAYIEVLVLLNEDFDKDIFTQNGIEIINNELIISREILASGSRFRVNGILVNHEFIKDIREQILDIHSQHQSYNYLQQKNHIILLDNFALKPHRDNIEIFKDKYLKLLNIKKQLEEAKVLVENSNQQEEFLKFQIKEIEDAQIEDIDECEKLAKEMDVLANIEKLKELSYNSYSLLNGENENILSALGSVKSNLSRLSATDEAIKPLEEDFLNAYETLKEVSSELRNYSETKENDNERMDYIGERLSLLEKLKRKYGGSLEEILNTYEKLTDELGKIECSQDDIIKYEKEEKEINEELLSLASTITGARKELARVLSKAVTEELEKLELPKSRFEIDIQPCQMSEKGTDRVEFLISTNVSEDVKPLSKTASGGEISRIMLAIKTIFANADNTNTVIFDEIDTGISGKASQAVADAISVLSKTHQIILITHQPIIAAKAEKHFYVKKEQTDVTKINVYNLEGENRIKALALLAAGEINSESENFAKNLLGV